MRRFGALMLSGLMVLGVLVGMAPTTHAVGPAVLTGIVTRSGGALVDQATVSILTPGTTNVVVSSTTNTDGRYSLVVEEGTYDVLFTGPAGGGFGSARINGQIIAGTTEVDVILSVQTVAVTGTVTASTDENLSMGTISFNGPNANTSAAIDTNGTYTANLPTGTYNIQFNHMNMGNSNVPMFNLMANNVTITGNTTLDLTLPITPITVHIRDANGNPVTAGVSLSIPMPGQLAPGVHPTIEFRHNSFSSFKSGSDVVVSGTLGPLRLSVTPSNGPFPTGPTITTSLTLTGTARELTVLLSGDVINGNPDTSNDGDNVSDVVEGLGPNNGDGNLDGVADADQINVTSLPVLGATSGNDYVTIAAPAGTTLSDVYTLDPTNPAQVAVPPPANVTLPEGLTRFVVEGLTPGASTTVSIFTASTAGITGYAKYNETTHVWTTLPAANVAISAGKIDLTLTDGGIGDDDGIANGRIVDPGGPAIIVGQAPVITVKGVTEGSTYVLGKVPTTKCTAKDATTGKKATCLGVTTGGQANGIGDFTYTATATSKSGVTATTVIHYRVVYKFDGFLDPIHRDGREFKVGSTIKVQFRLRDSSGHHVRPIATPQWLAPVPVGVAAPTGPGSITSFTRDGSTWIAKWNTTGMAPGRYRIEVTLDDGTEHTVNVILERKR